jgi:hypothetical protein
MYEKPKGEVGPDGARRTTSYREQDQEDRELSLFPFSLLSQEDVLVINLSCENVFVLDSIIKKMESIDGVNRVEYFMPVRILVNEDWMREEIVKRLGSENLS